MLTSSLIFIIGNSNFQYNEGAQSIVYFDQSSAKSCEYLYIQNSKFYHNVGVPIYLSNQNLYISGNIEFDRNVAENGGAIYISDYSNVTIYKNVTVSFTRNKAIKNGGAIFLKNHSSIVFDEHHTIHKCYDNKQSYAARDQNFNLPDH